MADKDNCPTGKTYSKSLKKCVSGAYIDKKDSSIVVMSPEQKASFNRIKGTVAFPPGTSHKSQSETILDMINYPKRYESKKAKKHNKIPTLESKKK